MSIKRAVPLSVAFTLAMQGCFWGSCGDTFFETTENLTEAEMRETLGIIRDGLEFTPYDSFDTFDPGGESAPPFEGEIVVEDLDCEAICSTRFGYIGVECGIDSVSDGIAYEVRCTDYAECTGGRHHAVVCTVDRGTGVDATAAWLAQIAHDEEASVYAFVALAEELMQLGAPLLLRQRALEAARDEVRHARMLARLARARGGVVPKAQTQVVPTRDLEAVALENAVEATVHETWAAMQAWHQSQHAHDPELRRVMAVIAEDETRHAELGRDLHLWFCSQLDREAVARIEAARQSAIDGLVGLAISKDAEALGLPHGLQAQMLIASLRQTIWA